MIVADPDRRDRKAHAVEQLSEADLQAIAGAEVPAEHARLDAELERRVRLPTPRRGLGCALLSDD